MAAPISLMQRAPTRGSFEKGRSGNPAGKRRGTANRVTVEAREAAALIVDDPAYREELKQRVIKGTAAQMEVLLWAYAKGRPAERIEHGAPGAFSAISNDELRQRLAAALSSLR